MKIERLNRLTVLPGLLAAAALTGTAHGTTYVWIGTNNDLDNAANWTYDGGLEAGDPATPIKGGNQIDTDSRSDDIIRFVGSYTTPQNIYTRTGTTWGSIEVLDGTVNWQNDGNNQGNYSFSDADSGGTPTVTVGNGDAIAAVANMNLQNWNQGGSSGTKTYVINSDGTLASARGGTYNWSNSASRPTVMRVVGGTVDLSGILQESQLLGDPGNYVSFEALGGTFTFVKGGTDQFDDAADVTGAFGDSFRLGGSLNSGNAALELTDNGGSWTVTAIVPEPASFTLLGLGGLLLGFRRRRD